MSITGERSIGMPIEDAARPSRLGQGSASGRETRSMRAREWTHAECAQANAGVERKYWLAQMYVYRLDNLVQAELFRELMMWAVFRRAAENWPQRFLDIDGFERDFLFDLLHMALVEIREPWRFARGPHDENPRRQQLRASKNTWQRKLSPIYEAILGEFQRWLSIGVGMANAKLREDAD